MGLLLLTSCVQNNRSGAEPGMPVEPYEPYVEYRTDLEPNRWLLLQTETPNDAYETTVVYDPVHKRVLRHGGHMLRRSAQSSYTTVYDPFEDAFSELPATSQRMCLVEGVWVDSRNAFALVGGIVSHGSVAWGRFNDDYTRLEPADTLGPFFYTFETDAWVMMRPGDVDGWPLRPLHAPVAYDPSSDTIWGLVGSTDGKHLYAYNVHLNTVKKYPVPDALWRRLFYGIAVDPNGRKLAIFGGSTGWNMERHDDLWLFDLVTHEWTEGPKGPPGGIAGKSDFLNRVLLYHGPSHGFLLFDHDVDGSLDPESLADAGPLTTWRLDLDEMTWEKLPTSDAPPFLGRIVFAENLDAVFLWGGGPDKANKRSTSRSLYVMRPWLPGARYWPAPTPSVDVRADGALLMWAAKPGTRYEVARAEVAGGEVGRFERIGQVTATSEAARFLDDPQGGHVAYRIREVGSPRWSLVRFNAPDAPEPPVVTVEPDGTVNVAIATEAGTKYWIERAHGAGEFEVLGSVNGTGGVVTFRDTEVNPDINEGVPVWRYRIGAADSDRPGVLSGYSPAQPTVPGPPRKFQVEEVAPGRVRVSWEPASAHDRLRLYYNDYFCNARGGLAPTYAADFYDLGAFRGESFEVDLPELDHSDRDPKLEHCPEGGRYDYFYARVQDARGQLGFWSDTRSPNDATFHNPGDH